MKNGKKRMLIVIKDDAIKKLLVEIFSKKFSITTATEAKDALRLCKTQVYSVLLLDNDCGDGLKVIQNIREACDYVQIVLMTGSGSAEAEAISAGANAQINKPFVIEEIERLVESLVKEREDN